MVGPNFHPKTFWAHFLVDGGSALTSSVCVIRPCRTLIAAAGADAALLRTVRRAAGRFFATFFDLLIADLALAMRFSSSLKSLQTTRVRAAHVARTIEPVEHVGQALGED